MYIISSIFQMEKKRVLGKKVNKLSKSNQLVDDGVRIQISAWPQSKTISLLNSMAILADCKFFQDTFW